MTKPEPSQVRAFCCPDFARARREECGHDFFVAFSCKGGGVCPSCNTRRMAEAAAHRIDCAFPAYECANGVFLLGAGFVLHNQAGSRPGRRVTFLCLAKET